MPIRTIGVIGAGTMGAGIAQIAITAGLSVILIDVNDSAVEKGLDVIKANLDRMVAKGKLAESAKDTALVLLQKATAFEVLRPAEVVIEAANEDLDLKLNILRQVD